ncbi:MAG: hypothetical protein ABF521_03555 [Acetobacter orientalis]|uniref:hypothetical protein n=1 Tax=Acetobacter orientalis TaxID=146474 RepID=UPI0039EB2FF8
MSGWIPTLENQKRGLEKLKHKPHLSLSIFNEVFMTNLVNFNPQEIEHAAHAISAVTHAVPGLYQALYETIGLFWTDPIKRKRREKNLKAEFEMAEEMIKGKKRLDDISATLAKEVLEPAMEEDREELQKIWAALLARIMIGKDKIISGKIIDIIKECDSYTAIIVSAFPDILADAGQNMIIEEMVEVIVNKKEDIVDIDDVSIALRWLEEKGCLKELGRSPVSYTVTALGRKLIQAVTFPENKEETE